MRYTFFMICDCRDSLDFEIMYTSMKDPRLRFSAMKSAWKRWANSDVDSNTVYRSYFKYYNSGYVCISVLEKKECTNEEAIAHANSLTEEYKEKFKNTSKSNPFVVHFH